MFWYVQPAICNDKLPAELLARRQRNGKQQRSHHVIGAASFWQPGWNKTIILFGNHSKTERFTINMKLKAWCSSDPKGMWILLQDMQRPVDELFLDSCSSFPESQNEQEAHKCGPANVGSPLQELSEEMEDEERDLVGMVFLISSSIICIPTFLQFTSS